ncbi:hypothetical protein HAX54_021642 [Datura stramonium]|uniref:MADS-box domain-containing protein n=1 Tax=Datura stramonium TaxID=4076 RepID=A0ABS8RMZ1_DATST|nr:hypothetical protein [Datura stramonium]
MKKTMELSVLCDVKACAIIIDADGTVETWPKNSTRSEPNSLDRNGDESDAEREEFSEILRQITGSSVEEIGAADEHQCPLGYWDGGPIEEQQCPLGYWNGGPLEEQQCPLLLNEVHRRTAMSTGVLLDGYIDCNYGQHEQPCPDYWDFEQGQSINATDPTVLI